MPLLTMPYTHPYLDSESREVKTTQLRTWGTFCIKRQNLKVSRASVINLSPYLILAQ